MFKYLSIVILSMFLVSCNSTKKQDAEVVVKKKKQRTLINFVEAESLTKVLDMAIEEDKLVFLYMHTEWCSPCRFMEKEVFSVAETAAVINDNFIPYEVDMEKANGPDLSLIFNAKVVPTMLFINSKGREVSRNSGGIGNTKLINWSNSVLDSLKGI